MGAGAAGWPQSNASRGWPPLLARFGDFGQITAQIRPKGGSWEGMAVGNGEGRVQNSSTIVLRREFPLLGPYIAPRTSTERELAEIWCRALGMDEVSIADNFEELGGDSLLAVDIFADIEEAFSVAVPIGLLARAPTIEQLARQIEQLTSKR